MSFSIGIVGLPNVGKSTLFKALTKKQVDVANYPFCTIDPNIGVVAVPDERLDKMAEVSKSEKIVPTTIEFVDIAGLVKDAHKGEGLGNQFLSHIREVDAIAQVIRKFSDSNVVHVSGKIDPQSDKETINLELIFADLQTIDKRHQSLARLTHGQDKEAVKALAVIDKIKAALDQGQLAKTVELTVEEETYIKDLSLLTKKPMLYVLNVDESDEALAQADESDVTSTTTDKDNPSAERQEGDYIPISAKIEAELSELPAEDAKQYLKELGLKESGLDKLITASYKLLDLITFFTSGPKETKAWTIKRNSKAPQAAGVIHTDFEKGFIRAEVINWQDFVDCGGDVPAKEKGLVRLEGKEYLTQDGDVVHFRFSV
ncbi:MAG: redox-regulated ATPase YchF [Candidatus Buchananbacteria bacterium RIFCSPLOWO2_01_FULL_46_12]|uniref:Ribosome-binding ATPase YchF n=1 Tax=Candidatus Buchananbacteria bacterium RIFCSPLOWO2_01_FULL_46_12 TaxID=1797546 RepID=A0A1G1YRF2_9BACT|nr:MAG: redox-regulated ATPase YchF [Candidatus Buchananbacteria bacterium RIFCSPLOWO2_01_FULL_46_12]